MTFDNMNHKLDGSTAYDAAGDVVKDASHSYSYDADNNLLTVDGGSTASYNYDVLNERTQVKLPANSRPNLEFTYDYAGRRVGVWDANANVGIQGQIWWGSQPFAYRDTDGNTYFEFLDWEGTQRVLTWSGTEHAQFRQLNASVGTWMSMDPYLGSYAFTNPQSLNRYTYALNNPTSAIDPSGRSCVVIFLPSWSIDAGGGTTSGTGEYEAFCDADGVGPQSTSNGNGNSSSGQTPDPLHAPNNPGVSPCVGANFAQRAAVSLLSPLAAKTGATVGYGVGGSIGAGGIGPFGFNFAVSQQLLVSPDGTAGLATTYTKQLFSVASKGFGGIVGFQAAFSNAKTFIENAGLSIDAGIMAADEVGAALDVTNAGATVTVGAGFGGRGPAGTFTYTVVTPFCGIGG